MHYLAITTSLLLAGGFAQTVSLDTPITSLPLNHEQVAVYRTALAGMKSSGPFDMVDLTGRASAGRGRLRDMHERLPCVSTLSTPAPLEQKIRQFKSHGPDRVSQTVAEHPFTGYAGEMHGYFRAEAAPPPDRPCRSRCTLRSSLMPTTSGQP